MAIFTPNTGSIINNQSGQDRTGVSLSTNIIIRVGATAVGAVQTLSVREARTVTEIDEVGTDGHIDSAPTKSADFSGDCRRIRYDRLRITEAFDRGYLHIHAQRIPFDIDIYDISLGDSSLAIVTTIKNIWIQSIGYSYAADNFIIVDDMAWVAETIYSTLNGGNAATGGARGNPLQINTIERKADVGVLRGALDSPGLINDLFSNG